MDELKLEIEKLREHQLKIVDIERRILGSKKWLEDCEKSRYIEVLKIEKGVFTNPEYKNEGQRKVAISEGLMESVAISDSDKSIATTKECLAIDQFEISCLKAEIEYSRNMIEFFKLSLSK